MPNMINGIKYYHKKEEMKLALTKPEDNYVIEFMDKSFYRKFTFIPKTKNFFTEIKKLMNNKRYYITEMMLNGIKRKPFLDYDQEFDCKDTCDKKYVPIVKKLIDDVIKVFKTEYDVKLKKEDIKILDSSRQKENCYKLSVHIIISPKDNTYYYTDCKHTDSSVYHLYTSLTKLNSDYLIDNVLDPQVYRSDGTLRIIGSSKGKKDDTILTPIDSETYEVIELDDTEKLHYLTTYIDDHKLIKLKTPVMKQVKYKKGKIYEGKPPTTNYIKKMTELVRKYRSDAVHTGSSKYRPDAAYTGSSKYRHNFQYSKRKDPCPITGNVHSGTNQMYCYETSRGIYLKCYSTSCMDKGSIHLGYIDEEDEFVDNSVQINQQYLMECTRMKELIDEWISKKHTLAVKSPMGTGKTMMVKKILKNSKFKKVLWITHRQTLTMNIYGGFKEFGFVNYMGGTKSLYDKDKVIVQIDSLMRISNSDDFEGTIQFHKYDLVIIDEVEGALGHYSSPYLKNPNLPVEELFDNMFNLLKRAKKVLLLDADLGIRAKLLIEELGNAVVVNNNYEPVKKTFNIIDENESFKNYFLKDITSGSKVCVVSMSSGYLENIAIEISALNKKGTYLGKEINNIKYVLHTSKADDELKVNLENVNKFWTQYDVVLYSPTIESGVDFNEKHFDKIYGIIVDGPVTCSQRSFLQMMGRIRNVGSLDVLCLYEKMYQVIKPIKPPVKQRIKKRVKKGSKKQVKNNNKTPVDNKERKLVLDADVYTYENLLTYFKHFETLNGKRILRKVVTETTDDDETYTIKKKHADIVLFDKINLHNEVEHLNKHHAIFATVLKKLIIKAGHNVTFNKVKRCDEGEFVVDIAKRKARMIESMVEIDETKFDMKDLQSKKMKSNLTEEEKLVLDKVHFKKTFCVKKNAPKGEMEKQLKMYYGKETQLCKVELLLDYKKLPDFDKDTFRDGKERTRKSIVTDLIKRLIGKKEGDLELDDVKNVTIPHAKYIAALKNIVSKSIYFKNPDKYRCLYFKSKSKSEIKTSDKQFQAKCTKFLQSILASYGVKLRMNKNVKTKKGIREFQYSLCVDEHIVDIIERKYGNDDDDIELIDD